MLFPTFRLWRQRIAAARVVDEAGLRKFTRLQAVTGRVSIVTLILFGVWTVFGAVLFVWSLWYVGIDAPSKFQPTPAYHVFGNFVGVIGWLMFISLMVTGILHAGLLTRYGLVMTKWQRIRALVLVVLTGIAGAYLVLMFMVALVVAATK